MRVCLFRFNNNNGLKIFQDSAVRKLLDLRIFNVYFNTNDKVDLVRFLVFVSCQSEPERKAIKAILACTSATDIYSIVFAESSDCSARTRSTSRTVVSVE